MGIMDGRGAGGGGVKTGRRSLQKHYLKTLLGIVAVGVLGWRMVDGVGV